MLKAIDIKNGMLSDQITLTALVSVLDSLGLNFDEYPNDPYDGSDEMKPEKEPFPSWETVIVAKDDSDYGTQFFFGFNGDFLGSCRFVESK